MMQMDDDARNPYRNTNFDEPIRPERAPTNVLGIVGFVLAFCLPPIGFLLSLIAVMKPPRGFAIAGLIVSTILSIFLALTVIGLAAIGKPIWTIFEYIQDTSQIVQAANAYGSANGAAPADLNALSLPQATTIDPWGQPWRLTPGSGTAWTLESSGFDQTWGTSDDIRIESSMNSDRITEAWSDSLRAHLESQRTTP